MCTVGENVNRYSHCGKQYTVSSKKLKTELPCDPAIPLLDIWLKETKSVCQRVICTLRLTAALCRIVRYGNNLCSSVDMWIKMCYIYTTEYYLAMKEKEVLPFVTTWMDLEGIRLSEINQKKSSNTVWYNLHVESEKVKLKNGCRMVFSRGWGWGDGEMSVKEYKLAAISRISSGYLMYNTVAIVNSTVINLKFV